MQLVLLLGQSRVFFAMSRDGLLPPAFSRVHPRFRTPYIPTIITGIAVGLTAAFLPIQEIAELTNIGTLFAFSLVCIGVWILRHAHLAACVRSKLRWCRWCRFLECCSAAT